MYKPTKCLVNVIECLVLVLLFSTKIAVVGCFLNHLVSLEDLSLKYKSNGK